ncbi:hypothetical protein CCR75_005391 [Bremia lactucae]|uniref:Uncharacterized protein n=1 Tax=Bremia lactucae TaxID=4779 RepID=A0A976FL31_BRELC|nr:hypothetical protein CCR75_005391 [Bremia lactucae]
MRFQISSFRASLSSPQSVRCSSELDPIDLTTPSSNYSTNKTRRLLSNKIERCCIVTPSCEPCTDEIPSYNLVFWMGYASTGKPKEILTYQQAAFSSRVPMINMPRIEGVN